MTTESTICPLHFALVSLARNRSIPAAHTNVQAQCGDAIV